MGFQKSLLCIAVLTAPLALAQGLPELGDSAASTLSKPMERRIGEEAYRNIRFRNAGYLDDPEIAKYVAELGSRLVKASDERDQDFEFFVIRDNTINAFAMPGGYIGVHTGLLLAAQTESEIAAVLAHEVSHVTQRHISRMLGRQGDASVLSVAAMVIALIAARSSPELAQLTVATANAGAIQAQLNYSRDFEREADRVGFQLLGSAGFDVHAMASFFEKMQKAGRFYDQSAPAYLRTHPLSSERMSDMQNRVQSKAYKQIPDSIEFHLVRAKLRAEFGDAKDAVISAKQQLEEKRYASEPAARYYLVAAMIRDNDFAGAEREIERLRNSSPVHPMIEGLAARLKIAQKQGSSAIPILRNALDRFPRNMALSIALVQVLQAQSRHAEALVVTDELLKGASKDASVFEIRARSFAATGQQLRMHQAIAEQYYFMGSLPGAIEQLELAQKFGKGDFYQLSVIEARLREIRKELLSQTKMR